MSADENRVVKLRVAEPRTRARVPNDDVWDACEEALGYGPLTVSEKRIWGKMTHSLSDAGATAERIKSVAAWYRKHWPDVDLTITALEKWYSHFLRMAEKQQRFVCSKPGCGLPFNTQGKLDDHMRNVHEQD